MMTFQYIAASSGISELINRSDDLMYIYLVSINIVSANTNVIYDHNSQKHPNTNNKVLQILCMMFSVLVWHCQQDSHRLLIHWPLGDVANIL